MTALPLLLVIARLLGGLVGLAVAFWALHRLYLYLDARDYIYHRNRPSGGGGVSDALNELARLTQPSIQHVEAVREEAMAAGDILAPTSGPMTYLVSTRKPSKSAQSLKIRKNA